jgi:hypothetical protein
MQAIEKVSIHRKQAAKPEIRRNRSELLTGIAMFLFASGFILPVAGMIFVIVHSILADDSVFDRIGTVLMIASIPVLLIGSHLMDLTERRNDDE